MGSQFEGAGIMVVVDTSMLLSCEEQKVDVFEAMRTEIVGNISFVVPKQVIEELNSLSLSAGKRAAVNVAKELMEKNRVRELDAAGGTADNALVELGKKGAIVATNDGALRRRLKEKGIKNVYLRDKKNIELSWR